MTEPALVLPALRLQAARGLAANRNDGPLCRLLPD
jgi:hypothetical protein